MTLGAVVSTVNERVPLKDELAFELSTFFARHQYCVAVWRLNGPGTAALPVWPTLRLVEVESNVPSDVEHELSAQTSKTTLPKSSVSSSSKDAESVGRQRVDEDAVGRSDERRPRSERRSA